MRRQITSSGAVNVYDGLEGRRQQLPVEPPIELPAEDVVVIRPRKRETQIHAPLRKAVEARQQVTSAAAIGRHDARLAGLGLPTPLESISIEQTRRVHLPVYIGLLRREHDRFVAVSGITGRIDERLGRR